VPSKGPQGSAMLVALALLLGLRGAGAAAAPPAQRQGFDTRLLLTRVVGGAAQTGEGARIEVWLYSTSAPKRLLSEKWKLDVRDHSMEFLCATGLAVSPDRSRFARMVLEPADAGPATSRVGDLLIYDMTGRRVQAYSISGAASCDFGWIDNREVGVVALGGPIRIWTTRRRTFTPCKENELPRRFLFYYLAFVRTAHEPWSGDIALNPEWVSTWQLPLGGGAFDPAFGWALETNRGAKGGWWMTAYRHGETHTFAWRKDLLSPLARIALMTYPWICATTDDWGRYTGHAVLLNIETGEHFTLCDARYVAVLSDVPTLGAARPCP